MKREYTVHAGVYEDTWHDYATHKRHKIWRADVRGKRKEGVALSPTLSHGRGGEGSADGRVSPRHSPTERGAAQVKADWVRNNFFALRKY